MASLRIGELARRVGLTPSALRYYERVGLVPHPPRSSRRRCYDEKFIGRIRIVMLARDAGFSIEETRAFVSDYPGAAKPSARWRAMAERKLLELDALAERIRMMMALLNDSFRCDCAGLEECGRVMVTRDARRTPREKR